MTLEEKLKKIQEIQRLGLYDEKQLEFIKFAIHHDSIDERLFLNSNNIIPSEFMNVYIQYLKRKQDVSKYINNKWHALGFNAEQLYYLIWGDLAQVQINDLSVQFTALQIKEIISNRINEKKLLEEIEQEPQKIELYSKFKSLGFSTDVIKYLINISEFMDVEYFLDSKFVPFSFEQINYFITLLQTESYIDDIMDPNLTVKEMKEIVLRRPESLSFVEQIRQNVEARKR